jgi:hypothetical protein
MSTLSTTNLKNPSAGSNNIVLNADGTTTVTAPSNIIKSGTVNAGGTNPFPPTGGPTVVDFTGIPSWAKRVTVMFNGVSTSGTSNLRIQIGSGSVDNTGYSSSYGNVGASSVSGAINSTSGWEIFNAQTNSTNSGIATICLLGSNIWTFSSLTSAVTTVNTVLVGGVKTALSGTLDRVRITTVNGTDLFDAGSINILWEG